MLPTRRFPLFVCALLLLAAGSSAHAQIALPPVQVPNLPGLPTDSLNRTVNGVLDQADVGARLSEVRQLRIRNLLRSNRTVLEADPRGAPIVRSEVVALSPTPAALDRARAAGFGVGRTRTLEGLDVSIVVLQAPPGMSTRRALERLRREDPEGTYDYNHVYLESGEVGPAAPAATLGATGGGVVAAKVGLIDGGVQRSHSVFDGVVVHEHGCAGGGIPSAHGTAVASLLVGRGDVFHGAAPGAELFAADVYCGLATGGALDSVAEAFAWMSREKVPVINISLVGPPNVLLEQIVRVVTSRGHLIVAAVGNDGPSAPPLFPAAYPAVIAVTGVDAKQRVLVEACRGKHVDFSAPGANMSAAGVESPFGLVRGTSFAAPIVAGLLAAQLSAVNKEQADAAVAALVAQATDLGAKGVDKVYGNGLVGNDLRPSEQLASAPR
ncbi:S8 family serine peptidase [Steroidobacter sp.]|uniref:S8 family serine peptidase n=1 Tax=Steroidobacter sp. TaxID=1978227 RepID=UPI001A56352F|nr:S8 family serine peptidase [Steroidobacter sp.]MBL8271455.1 S8 family serine peptidase [Steroidobacter sp.]